jgi:prepilin peptidase CpaA
MIPSSIYAVSPIFSLPLVVFVSAAAVIDVRERKIPNDIVVTGMAIGLLLAFLTGSPGIAGSAGGLAVGIVVLFPVFALGWLGAGDVKLMGAVGSFVGAAGLPRVFFYTALAGGVVAAVAMAVRSFGASPEAKSRLDKIPYGVAIGLGAAAAVLLDPRGDWAGF